MLPPGDHLRTFLPLFLFLCSARKPSKKEKNEARGFKPKQICISGNRGRLESIKIGLWSWKKGIKEYMEEEELFSRRYSGGKYACDFCVMLLKPDSDGLFRENVLTFGPPWVFHALLSN